MCGVVEFWASKGRHNPRGGSKGHGENSFFFEIVLLQQSVWRRWRFGVKEAEEVEGNGVSFCLFGEGFNILFTWQKSIGWYKTLVLRHSPIECFLFIYL